MKVREHLSLNPAEQFEHHHSPDGALPFRGLEWLAAAACALCALVAFIPAAVMFPQSGVDPSWRLAMVHAVAEGLVIGREVVFTYGPHGNTLTGLYHPEIFHMSMLGGFYLACVFMAAVSLLAGERRLEVLVLSLIICALGFMSYTPTGFMGLIFFIGLAALSVGRTRRKITAGVALRLAFIFSGLGFMFLVKCNQASFAVMTAGVCCLYFLSLKNYGQAALAAAVPAVSAMAFWVLAGQPLPALVDYVATMPLLIGGYSEAMNLEAPARPVTAFIILALAVVFLIWRQERGRSLPDALAPLLLFALFLFLLFKGFFVLFMDIRLQAVAWVIVIAALSLPLFFGKLLKAGVGLSLAALLLFPPLYDWPLFGELNILALKFRNAAASWSAFILDKKSLDLRYEKAMATIKSRYDLPSGLPGSVDVYCCDQAALLASGNVWKPRPVFQSYAAYNPPLADLNRRSLLNRATAPDYVFFALDGWRGDLETADDGASWPALLWLYQPERMTASHLILKRRAEDRPVPEPGRAPAFTAAIGQRITLTETDGPLFIRLGLRMNLTGRAFTTLYKPKNLYLLLETEDGRKLRKRIVSGRLQSGYILSRVVTRPEHFAALYSAPESLDRVVAITVEEPDGAFQRALWRPDFEVYVDSTAPRP